MCCLLYSSSLQGRAVQRRAVGREGALLAGLSCKMKGMAAGGSSSELLRLEIHRGTK